MDSTSSSPSSDAVRSALKAAAEAAAAGAVLAGGAAWMWPSQRVAVALGAGAAWAASSTGTAWLMVAKTRGPQAFWWAFGGGMAVRFLAFVALAGLSLARPSLPQAGLLLSYALGVLLFLMLEYRHVRLK